MKVLSELADSIHCKICKISALCKYQISQSRSNINDLFHSPVCQTSTACKVKNSKVFIELCGREVEECIIGDQFAVCEPQFT
jgi:hypothetical protein